MIGNVTYKKLGEVATVHDNLRKPVTKSDRKAGVYPYYGATGIQDYVDNYIFDGRYLLVGEDGAKWGANDKSAYIIEGKSWVNNHAHVLTFNEGICDSFVAYYLNYENLDPYISGAIVRKLTQKALLNISIPVPSLEDQQRIVRELDAIHAIIDAKNEQLRELDNLAQAIFYDMFGDPITNEKGWEVKKIGEVGSVERGAGISKKDFVEDGKPCIHYGQLHTSFGALATKHISCIPQGLIEKPRIAHHNDVVMAITSEDVEGSCKSTAWMGDYDVIVGSDAAIFHHSQNGIYVSFYTQTKAFYNEKEKYANGFKVTHISAKDIESIPIMLPPLDLQQAFASKITAIEQQKELIRASIAETETLLAARMQHYFD